MPRETAPHSSGDLKEWVIPKVSLETFSDSSREGESEKDKNKIQCPKFKTDLDHIESCRPVCTAQQEPVLKFSQEREEARAGVREWLINV